MPTRRPSTGDLSGAKHSLSQGPFNGAFERTLEPDPESLLGNGRRRSFSAGDVIYREGDAPNTVYAIHSGLVKLLSYLPNGRARIVRLHARGAWIGLSGLVHQPYEHTAVAVDDVEVSRVPVSSLHRLRTEEPARYCAFVETWYWHLREADIWISQFSTGSIKSRVARLINFLSDIEHTEQSSEVKLLTCEEMAAVLGVTPESVSRILAEFKRTDVLRSLRTRPTELYDRDTEALAQVAQR